MSVITIRHGISWERNGTALTVVRLCGQKRDLQFVVTVVRYHLVLPPFDQPPPELRQLYDDPLFSMGASAKANDRVRQDTTVTDGGVCNYRIQGALCHRIGSLTHLPDQAPLYAQLYFYDSSDAEQYAMLDARMSFRAGLNRHIMSTLQRVLTDHNTGSGENIRICLHSRIAGVDQRRLLNRPMVAEIGGLFIEGQTAPTRELMVQSRSTGQLITVFEQHSERDAMQL